MEQPSGMLRGDRLRACREQAGLTLQQVAESCGLTAPYLSQLERGVRRRISAEAVARLALTLSVSTDFLLGLSDKQQLDPNLYGTAGLRGCQPLPAVPWAVP